MERGPNADKATNHKNSLHLPMNKQKGQYSAFMCVMG